MSKSMDYNKKTLKELKEIAKKNGLRGYSKLKKADLIKMIKKSPICVQWSKPVIKKTPVKKKTGKTPPAKRKISSKTLLKDFNINKKLSTKKKWRFKVSIGLFDEDKNLNIWYLINEEKTMVIFANQDLAKSKWVKTNTAGNKKQKPKWVNLSKRGTHTYIFGTQNRGGAYNKEWVDRLITKLKPIEMYFKHKDFPLMIKGKEFTGFVAPRTQDFGEYKDITDVFIPFNKFVELDKIPAKKLKAMVINWENSNKDNIIRQYYLERLVLDKPNPTISSLARILEFDMTKDTRGLVSKYYMPFQSNMALFLNSWITQKGKTYFRKKKPVMLDKEDTLKGKKDYIFIRVAGITYKEGGKRKTKYPKYYKYRLNYGFGIFKKPKIYIIPEEWILIFKERNINLIIAPVDYPEYNFSSVV